MVSKITQGIKVEVQSRYVAEQSDPALDRYVFAYHITIRNQSEVTVQLVRRHWYIAESNGTVREVRGDGVVGEQPILEPGDSHEYMSGAVLQGPIGSMHGSYEMHTAEGTSFLADIPKFELRMPRTLH